MAKIVMITTLLILFIGLGCSDDSKKNGSKNEIPAEVSDSDVINPNDNDSAKNEAENLTDENNEESDDLPLKDESNQSDTDAASDSELVETDSDNLMPDSDVADYEEPPLPPKLSFYFNLEKETLLKKGENCGIKGLSVAMPENLPDHLTTKAEYGKYKKCLEIIDKVDCDSAIVKDGLLANFQNCLYYEPEIYDPENKPEICPFTVEKFTFDKRRELFSLNNAYWLLNLSVLSKDKDEEATFKLMKPYGFTKVEVYNKGKLQFLMAEHAEFIVFAFKGTTTWQDYLSNAEYVLKDSEKTDLPGKVHSGFFGTMDSGWESLKTKFTYAKARGKSIIITGHSLGGAIAQMAALKAVKMKLPIKTIYVFASPRAGNEEFAKAVEDTFGAKFFRINNGIDMTPHVAPSREGESTAKETFLSLIGDVEDPNLLIKGLDSMLDWGLNYADYTHPNDEHWIDEKGYFQGLIPYSDKNDIAYYLMIREKFDGNSFFDFTSELGALPQYHDDTLHLCYQARMIEQLIYKRD